MIKGLPIGRARREIDRAVDEATPRFGVDLPNEPEALRHLLTSVESRLNGLQPGKFTWRAATINAANKTESRTGADFLGLLTVDVPGLHLTKGFLAQAKMADADDASQRRRLREQCARMLKRSSASFVLTLGPEGVRVIPALSVLTSSEPLARLHSLSFGTFMETHFRSFIGDRGLAGANLQKLMNENRRRSLRVLALRLSVDGEPLVDPDSSDEAKRLSLITRLAAADEDESATGAAE